MKHNLIPNIDLQSSRDYFGAYNTQDLYKGKSFNMAGEGKSGAHYFNDESLQDFVSYKGALLSCIKSHISDLSTEPALIYDQNDPNLIVGIKSNHGNFVLSGVQGEQGDSITDIKKEIVDNGTAQELTIIYGNGDNVIVKLPHGITPIFKIENNLGNVSYDRGSTGSILGNSVGKDGLTHYFTSRYQAYPKSKKVNNITFEDLGINTTKPIYYDPKTKQFFSGGFTSSTSTGKTTIPTTSLIDQNVYRIDLEFYGIENEQGLVLVNNTNGSIPYVYIYGPESTTEIDGGETTFINE